MPAGRGRGVRLRYCQEGSCLAIRRLCLPRLAPAVAAVEVVAVEVVAAVRAEAAAVAAVAR